MVFINIKGLDLEEFIKENDLKQNRYFYIISANSDDNMIFKLGQGGMKGTGNTRLKSYLYYYGYNNRKNPKQGVKIHYFIKTKYNKNVWSVKTKIHKLEVIAKRYIKKQKLKVSRRGTERFYNLKALIKYLQNVNVKTEVVKLRRSKRHKEYEVERIVEEYENHYLIKWKGYSKRYNTIEPKKKINKLKVILKEWTKSK